MGFTQRLYSWFNNLMTSRMLPSVPQVNCKAEILGSSYGSYAICPDHITPDSIVYSFGVGEDISFDLALINRFGVSVCAFDPTPRSVHWLNSQTLPEGFRFFDYGIADFDGTARFYLPENPDHVSCTILDHPKSARQAIDVPVYRLQTIMHMLGHQRVSVLKLDIEGAEYAVLNNVLAYNVPVEQILVEFHHRFPGVGANTTKETISLLNKHGYKAFYVSPSQEEYSFIFVPA